MNILRKQNLSRRTLLRGAGAALGLPWLEAMAVAAPEQDKGPVRMAMLYVAISVIATNSRPPMKASRRERALSRRPTASTGATAT